MFEEVMRLLKELEGGVEVSIPMETDDDGYWDRLCPSDECEAEFKILLTDWNDKVKKNPGQTAFCPLCRHEAGWLAWNTPEQQEYIEEAGHRYLRNQLGEALEADSARFNRSQSRHSFIKMTMSYRAEELPEPVIAKSSDVMTQLSTCEECKCQYSSVGAAFFCPACGHNSAASTFEGAVSTIRKTLGALDELEEKIAAATDKDHARNVIRSMLESQIERIVASFQRYAEALFEKVPNRASFKVKKNMFQRLSDASDLWKSAIGVGYGDLLTAAELDDLTRLFQQRHLLAHREGIVDQEYIDKSGDRTWTVGQRLVVREEGVRQLTDLVSKLGDELKART
jgi:hypothetical protein